MGLWKGLADPGWVKEFVGPTGFGGCDVEAWADVRPGAPHVPNLAVHNVGSASWHELTSVVCPLHTAYLYRLLWL